MVSGINDNNSNIFSENISPSSFLSNNPIQAASTTETTEPLNSFAQEDQAIISSQAKLLNALDKFNSGGDNGVELAVANVMAKTTVEAEVNVIQTKKDMIDDVLDIGK